jgi:hypothetical protein
VSNNFTIVAISHQLGWEATFVLKNDFFSRTVLTLQELLLSINFVILGHTHFLVEALWYVEIWSALLAVEHHSIIFVVKKMILHVVLSTMSEKYDKTALSQNKDWKISKKRIRMHLMLWCSLRNRYMIIWSSGIINYAGFSHQGGSHVWYHAFDSCFHTCFLSALCACWILMEL